MIRFLLMLRDLGKGRSIDETEGTSWLLSPILKYNDASDHFILRRFIHPQG